MRLQFGGKISVEINDKVAIAFGLFTLVFLVITVGHLGIEDLKNLSPFLHSLLV